MQSIHREREPTCATRGNGIAHFEDSPEGRIQGLGEGVWVEGVDDCIKSKSESLSTKRIGGRWAGDRGHVQHAEARMLGYQRVHT